MSEHRVDRGIEVTYTDGVRDDVFCDSWWVGDGVLHTRLRQEAVIGGKPSPIYVQGPSFPFCNMRKWEEMS